ncbi:MAG: hypothetical protein KAK01_01995 [Candidatus Marinimicrobia bacterium]|nr:hypothetical protein [Candidatus Neomarinimicrobiota bacterium]
MEKHLIYEPMTVITDLILAGMTAWFAWELGAWYWERLMNVHWHFSRAFWMLTLGALLAAISHGIGPHLSPGLKDAIWKLTTISIGFASFFLLMSSFHHVFPYDSVRLLRWIPVILLAGYLVIIWRDPRFINVIRFYAPTMIFVLLVMIYSYFANNGSGSGWLIAGILVSFAAAGVQMSGFTLHKHFNHNDIYHVIQMVGMYLLYRGSLLLNDFGVTK